MMADKGYDVAVRLSGKDDLSSVVKRPKNAVDELSHAADPKAKGAFASFARSAITHLSALKPVLDLIKRGLGGLQSMAMSAFRHIVSGAKLVSIALMGIIGLMIKWGSDVVESENLFKVSMGEMVSDAERWAELTARALRMNENDIKKYLGTFNVMLVSMGLAPAKAYEMSKAFTKLTYDLASFYNLKPDEAFEKLQAGITGEIEPLKRLGIIVNDTAVQHYALAKGIGAAGKEMTEAEKILARYGLIMERTNAAQGDMERTADSASNTFKAIWAAVKQTIQEIGKGIIESKAFAGALAWVGGLFAGLKDTADSAQITQTIDKWTAAVGRFFTKTLNIEARLKNLKEQAMAILQSIPIGGTVTETTAHSSGFKVTREEVTRPRTLADLNLKDMFKGAMGEDIKKAVGDALTWIESKLLQAFEYIRSGKAKQDWEDFTGAFGDASAVFMEIFGVVSKVVVAVMNFTKEHPKIVGIGGAFAVFSPILAPIAVALAGIVSLLVSLGGGVVIPALTALVGFLGGPLTLAILAVIAAAVLLYKNWDDVVRGLGELWRIFIEMAVKQWESLKTVFGLVVKLIAEIWKSAVGGWKMIWQDFTGLIKSAWNGVQGFLSKSWNGLKGIWQSAVDFIQRIWDSTIGRMIDKMITFLKWLNLYETHSPSAVSLWSSALTQMDKDFDKFSARVTEKASSMAFSMAPMPYAGGCSGPASPPGGSSGSIPNSGDTRSISYNQTFQLPPEAGRNPLDPERYALAVENAMLRKARSGI